jgi:hypothetical protein
MSMHEWSMAAPVVKVPKLRSRRCQRCRWRKIKCDENWPTCTPCTKARCPCSGPPASLDSDSDSGSVMPSRAGSPALSSHFALGGAGDVDLQLMEAADTSQLLSHYQYPGGSSYTRVRLAPAPRSYPTTTADRVASRLAAYLERGSRFDASLAADYFRLLPARLGASAALRDAVALFCMGWGNFRRASPPKTIVDPRAYGKALRSLQRALSGDDNEGKQLACETLAAASVMDRVEVLFGGQQQHQEGLQSVTHARGIYSLMATRGPPNLDDDLDVCLAFGNQVTITNYLLTHGGSNFYLRDEWKDALYQAASNGTGASRFLIDLYFLSAQLGGYTELAAEVDRVTAAENPDEAALLLARLEGSRAAVHAHLEAVLAEARREGTMVDRPDASCPTGFELAFTDYDPMQRAIVGLAFCLSLNRLILRTSSVIPATPASALAAVDAEHRRLGELVWRCLPQMRRLGPVSSLLFLQTLSLSLGAAAGDPDRAREVVETVMRLGAAAGKLPQDLVALEALMLQGAMLWTGVAVAPQLGDAESDEVEMT